MPERAVLRLLLRAHRRVGGRLARAPCRPTTSTSCCCTAPTRWSSPRRWRARSTSSRPRARCARSASRTRRPRQIELLKQVRAPAHRGQPAAAVDHARADHRAGRLGEHGRARTSRSPSTAAGSSTTAACNDITIQAWSPFQAGFFTGVFLGSPDYPELNAVIDRLAAQYDVPADRDRDRLDHPAPRADAGGARHHEPGARARAPRWARTSR